MPDPTTANEPGLSSAFQRPYSRAAQVAEVFLNPNMATEEGIYPPVLSADAVASRIISSQDKPSVTEEETIRNKTFDTLIALAAKGLFEIVPLPKAKEAINKVGFRFTGIGFRAAVASMRGRGATLRLAAQYAEERVVEQAPAQLQPKV